LLNPFLKGDYPFCDRLANLLVGPTPPLFPESIAHPPAKTGVLGLLARNAQANAPLLKIGHHQVRRFAEGNT